MIKAKRDKMLHDEWPKQSDEDRKKLLKAIKKASKARIFEYNDCTLI